MQSVLFIKTSSLGDVIHHMPAVTEARLRWPGTRFGWVVEEAFAPLARLHPAVDHVIPVTMRRWRDRGFMPPVWSEIARFRRELRTRQYDAVIDTQGLLKSAVLARMARGPSYGYDTSSIKEPAASWLYDVCHAVEWNQHAIARNRALTAVALGYQPEGPVNYGLDRASVAQSASSPYGILLHATARAEKQWPEDRWRALTAQLGGAIDLVVPYGSDAERERALRIAAASPRARVPDRQPLDEVARMIAGASFVAGVDTGLLHLAAAFGVPLVAIFVGSEPGLTGPLGTGSIKVLGANGEAPSLDEVSAAVARVTS
ncbi:MAG TPA: lipopolysaccharide heptosyltransferase I [Vicinamibacterales bacterium]|nr:lipopolysaccharide heptosyltransferase I [Vicinamibacterales bacterium]